MGNKTICLAREHESSIGCEESCEQIHKSNIWKTHRFMNKSPRIPENLSKPLPCYDGKMFGYQNNTILCLLSNFCCEDIEEVKITFCGDPLFVVMSKTNRLLEDTKIQHYDCIMCRFKITNSLKRGRIGDQITDIYGDLV